MNGGIMNAISPDMPDDPMRDIMREIERRAKAEAQERLSRQMAKPIETVVDNDQDWVSNIQRQIMTSRRCLFWFILFLILLETVVLFVVMILAALPSKRLVIADSTLQIFTGATIAQASAMLFVIIRSVYSESLNQFIRRR